MVAPAPASKKHFVRNQDRLLTLPIVHDRHKEHRMSKAFIASALQGSADLSGVVANRAATDLIAAIVKEIKKNAGFTLPSSGSVPGRKDQSAEGVKSSYRQIHQGQSRKDGALQSFAYPQEGRLTAFAFWTFATRLIACIRSTVMSSSAAGGGPTVDTQQLAGAVIGLHQRADRIAGLVDPHEREAVPVPPLNSWQIMPVPPPTLPSATGPALAPSSAASARSAVIGKLALSDSQPS